MGKLVLALVASVAALFAAPLAGQQEGTVTVEVRVGSADRGWALIDRGSVDGLALGDMVVFLPREGGVQRGRVIELEERAARVELLDHAFVPAAGTRGRVEVPRSRAAPPRSRPGLRPAPKRGQPPPAPPPAFPPRDDGWQSGDPLLAKVVPVRPSERAARAHGRSFFAFDHAHAGEDERHDTLARLGGTLVIENPFGRGDRLHADGEWSYRHVDVPDFDGTEDVELRVDRLAYTLGGDRFQPRSLQLGRFLQEGMVEFGVLDGAEWLVRRRNGHRYGASVGFLPELDFEFQTGSDFQVAGFYEWVADESERTRVATGFQKTFHNGAADRDLVVVRVQRLPRTGWTFFGTTWIDLYTDGDDAKDAPIGVTHADLALGRRFAGGSSLDLVYRHLEFPDIERHEFLPVVDGQIEDDHQERLALVNRLQLTRDTRLLTALGVWTDEDEEGGDGELGLGVRDLWATGLFADASVFGTRGRFERSAGARVSAGLTRGSARWALDYEFAQHRLDGFEDDNDDLPQHRVRVSGDHAFGAWALSWRVEGLVYDDEHALQLGLFLQRSHY